LPRSPSHLLLILFGGVALGLGVDDLLGGVLDLVAVALEVLDALVATRVLVLERALLLARDRDARVVRGQLGVQRAREQVAVLPHLLLRLLHALLLQVLEQLDQLLLRDAQQVKHELVGLGRNDRGGHVALRLHTETQMGIILMGNKDYSFQAHILFLVGINITFCMCAILFVRARSFV